MLLSRCDGPACPKCGCEDSTIVETRESAAGLVEDHRCAYCGEVWIVPPTAKQHANGSGANGQAEIHSIEEFWGQDRGRRRRAEQTAATAQDVTYTRRGVAIVIYRPLRCPYCGSTHTAVDSTQAKDRRRHHKCRACLRGFWSVTEATKKDIG